MKKTYERPELEVIQLDTLDIVTTSTCPIDCGLIDLLHNDESDDDI